MRSVDLGADVLRILALEVAVVGTRDDQLRMARAKVRERAGEDVRPRPQEEDSESVRLGYFQEPEHEIDPRDALRQRLA
jgi:hypothetical protein